MNQTHDFFQGRDDTEERAQKFQSRRDAGLRLAEVLMPYAGRLDVIILGLARGGVPVAFEVARELGVPLDVFIVRKVGVPGHEELAMGAIASGGISYLNQDLIRRLGVSNEQLEAVIDTESRELARRESLYREGRPPRNLAGKSVILVDDGLATGASMKAAVLAVRKRNPKEVIVAVPVIAADSVAGIQPKADKLFYVFAPHNFYAVGAWYDSFEQTTDKEVKGLLKEANRFESIRRV